MVLQSFKPQKHLNLRALTQPWKAELSTLARAVKGGIIMTANQLRYAELREAQRHNRTSEEIEAEKAHASSSSALASHSMAGAQYASVAESRRHNQQMEDIGWNQYYSLSNLQSAQAGATLKDADTRRLAMESTERHYKRTDAIGGVRALNDTMRVGTDMMKSVLGIAGIGGKR